MYSQIASNKRKTWAVMAMFFVIIAILGWLYGQYMGDVNFAYVALIVAAIYATVQYFIAGKLALSVSGAKQIDRADNPRFYSIIENLTITTGLPMPKVYVIDDSAPNAFATGRNPQTASVAATSGLINMMTDRELTGVMAHEMSHVGNFDIKVSLVAFGLTSAISFLADMMIRSSFYGRNSRDRNNNASILLIIGAILAPIAAILIQLAVSRQREYLADATASLTTRDPDGLANALEKLAEDQQVLKHSNSSMANMYIKNPLKIGFLSNLMSTHPSLESRIKRLRSGGF